MKGPPRLELEGMGEEPVQTKPNIKCRSFLKMWNMPSLRIEQEKVRFITANKNVGKVRLIFSVRQI